MERHERMVEEINNMEEGEAKEVAIEELKEVIQDTFAVMLCCVNCGAEWEKRVSKGIRVMWNNENEPGLLLLVQDESGLEVGNIACPTCECARTLKRAYISPMNALLTGAAPNAEMKKKMEALAQEKLKNV